VVVIVNPANSVNNLASSMIGEIYSGKIRNWEEVIKGGTDQTIRVWSYLTGDDQRQVFDLAFLVGKEPSYQTYLAPDANAMLEAVTNDANAIGYILKSLVEPGVRQVSLNGAAINSLRQPVLALAQNEPQGNLKQLLLCVQNP
jgi:ABC-type phosphate transport system substrate-binding protein